MLKQATRTTRPRRRAMTLLEIVVVLILVGITSTIAVLSFRSVRTSNATRANMTDVAAIRASGRSVASANASVYPANLATRLTATGMDIAGQAKSTGSLVMSVVRVTPTIASYSVRSGDGCVGVLDDLTTNTVTWVHDDITGPDNCHAGILGARRAEPELAGASNETAPLVFDYDKVIPYAPTDLVAVQPAPGPVVLTWVPVPSPGNTGYSVLRDGTVIATVPADAVTYNDTTVPGGENVTYEVRADYTPAAAGTTSNQASLLTRPNAPTLTGHGADQTMTITWTGAGTHVSSYRILINGVAVKTTTQTTYDQTTSSPVPFATNTTFTYSVIANNASGDGFPGTLTLTTQPAAPTGLTAQALQPYRLDLSWVPSAGATGYQIWRDGTLYDTVGDQPCTPANGRQCYLDPTGPHNVTSGTTYTYTVRAINANGVSGDSNPDSATPFDRPGTPTGLTATPGNTIVTLTWTPITPTVAAPIAGYRIYVGGVIGCIAPGATASTCTVVGLTNGTQYPFQVVAYFSNSESIPSAAVYATPRRAPYAPTLTTATGANTSITATWTAPGDNGGAPIDTYTATAVAAGHTTRTCTATAPAVTCTIGSLDNGTTYTVTVTAHNVAGTGDVSNTKTAKPRTVPDAPTGVGVTAASSTSVSVSFSAPAWNGGDAISSYTATSSPGGLSATGTGSPLVVPGLTTGVDYTFTVKATNAAGTGPASAPSPTIRLIVAPGKVTGVAASPANASANVTWNAMADTNAAPLTGYNLFVNGGYYATVGKVTAATIAGLTNGWGYQITVQAYGPGGNGPVSDPASVTPRTVPDAPYNQAASANSGTSATITWATPGNGGSPILGYRVYAYDLGGAQQGVAQTGNSGMSFTGLSGGATYQFRIRAYNAVGDGPLSGYTNTVNTLAAPTVVNVSHCANGSYVGYWPSCFWIDWDDAAGATSYDLYRNGVLIKSGLTGSWFHDAGVWSNTSYTYQVFSRNGSASAASPVSAAISYAGGGVASRLPCADGNWTNFSGRGIFHNSGALEPATGDYCTFTGEVSNGQDRPVNLQAGNALDSSDAAPILRTGFTMSITFNTPALQSGMRLLWGVDATPPNSAGLYLIDGEPRMCAWHQTPQTLFCTPAGVGQVAVNHNYLMVGQWVRGIGMFMAVYDIDNGTLFNIGSYGQASDIWVDSYRASTSTFYAGVGGGYISSNPNWHYWYIGSVLDAELWAS